MFYDTFMNIKYESHLVVSLTLAHAALGRLMQENYYVSEDILGYLVKHWLNTQN